MAMTLLPSILENIRRRLRPSPSGVITDTQLLERFLTERDEAAFELLMWRHGPMVFGVCRRVLRHTQDAEDAFQATFLMLARKAASIGKRESVSGWLYTVAYRIALRARTRGARRGQVEKPLDELPIDRASSDPADVSAWRELRRLLDAELSQIPEKYRTAFILCHLEGKTCDEAAEHLGCPRGTVQSRVGRARERLRVRLARRGWLPASAPLIDLIEQHVSPMAGVSPALIYATVHMALLAALSKVLTGIVSSSVLELMNDTFRAMRWRRLRYLAVLAVLALLGGSAAAWGVHSLQSQPGCAASGCTAGQPAASCHGPSTLPGAVK
ncbi:MAG TPA: RNA polymerase sigma factor [Gemmataceae bacterium]|jgi:RNA polymerase sigma factor (sigma-70 family)